MNNITSHIVHDLLLACYVTDLQRCKNKDVNAVIIYYYEQRILHLCISLIVSSSDISLKRGTDIGLVQEREVKAKHQQLISGVCLFSSFFFL